MAVLKIIWLHFARWNEAFSIIIYAADVKHFVLKAYLLGYRAFNQIHNLAVPWRVSHNNVNDNDNKNERLTGQK